MSRPWMPLYVADYLADTMHLSTLENGAYMLLIMHYWRHSGLPDDDAKLARITRLTADEWAAIRGNVSELFSDGWKHKRIEFELTEAARVASAGRTGGKASAEKRKQNKVVATIVGKPLNDPPTIVQRSGNDLATIGQALQPQSPSQKKDNDLRSLARKRATRLPDDWQPGEADREFAVAQGLTESETSRQAERFRDFWLGKSGQNATKSDWPATWRNWIRTEAERLGRPPPPPVGKPQQIGHYAAFGSAELDSWDAHNRETKGVNLPRDKRGGWTVPARWPPGYPTASPDLRDNPTPITAQQGA